MNTDKISRLIIIAYRLPFKFVRNQYQTVAVQNSGGLVSAILSYSKRMQDASEEKKPEKILWVGAGEQVPANIANSEIYGNEFDLLPVTIPDDINEKYYGGFCNDLIWPLFHYFSPFTVYDDNYFNAYRKANEIFFESVKNVIRPGDLIWVHDYQLMLLPAMLRDHFPEANIGFFLHIPFPSFEVFRYMPRSWRKSLLNGMLGSNLLGFHTQDYARYFIRSVERTLGHRFKGNIILSGTRKIKAEEYPIGIDYRKYHDACTSKPVEREMKKIRKSIGDSKLIFSVDRLDYSKGLLERLRGFETFLEKYPVWHEKVIFNMVIVPSRDTIQRYQNFRNEIEATVSHINGKYEKLNWRPIIYQYRSLNFEELVALYDSSDVGLITPVRDGMNLVAKEYVACKVKHSGVLILSEMAGAASELKDALIINPTDQKEMAEAIKEALEMNSDEKKARIQRMQVHIEKHNVFEWANRFIYNVTTVEEKLTLEIEKSTFIDPETITFFKTLYSKAKKRILFLDYDGTLVPFSPDPENAKPEKQVLETIANLCSDKNNIVVIISGREMSFLVKIFKGIPVTIVSEHGYLTRDPEGKILESEPVLHDWRKTVEQELKSLSTKYPGSFIEEKQASVSFHYRKSMVDIRSDEINEVKSNLKSRDGFIADLEVLEGNKVLEFKHANYNKGAAARQLLRKDHFDFILAVGDDTTDEALFMAVPEQALTVRIGLNPSFAEYYLREQYEMPGFLRTFVSKNGQH